MKRLLAVFLVCILCLAACVPAPAAPSESTAADAAFSLEQIPEFDGQPYVAVTPPAPSVPPPAHPPVSFDR